MAAENVIENMNLCLISKRECHYVATRYHPADVMDGIEWMEKPNGKTRQKSDIVGK